MKTFSSKVQKLLTANLAFQHISDSLMYLTNVATQFKLRITVIRDSLNSIIKVFFLVTCMYGDPFVIC